MTIMNIEKTRYLSICVLYVLCVLFVYVNIQYMYVIVYL